MDERMKICTCGHPEMAHAAFDSKGNRPCVVCQCDGMEVAWRPEDWENPYQAQLDLLHSGVPAMLSDPVERLLQDSSLYEQAANSLLSALRKRGIRVEVEGKAKDEGARGNNPVRIRDSEGYNQMLWNHWTRELGLEPTMKGHIVFIPDGEVQ